MTRIKAILSGRWGFPIAAFVVCILAYGLLIPWLGFYWDDWPLAWFYRWLGPTGFISIWAKDRPAIGPLFTLTSFFFGDVPWRWHVFGLVTRWFSVVSLWQALVALWPNRPRIASWTAMLFAVFPGFVSQSIPYVYSHYFLILGILFSSWRWMILAVQDTARRKIHWALALVGSFVSTFTLEFFLGLELLRPLLLYFAAQGRQGQTNGDRIRYTLRRWAPFGALFFVYLIWRVFVVEFKAYQPILLDQLSAEPAAALASLLETMVADWFEVLVLAWARVFNVPSPSQFGSLSTVLFWLLVALSAVLLGVYLWIRKSQAVPEDGNSSPQWRRQALLLSLACIFLAGWPHWIPGLPMKLTFPHDRFTLGFMFASSLLLVVLIDYLGRSRVVKTALWLVIISLGIGWQFQVANSYRRAWESQARFMWQLAWRVPDLEPGTVILTNEIPLDYMTDNSLTGAINWMYAPEGGGQAMPFMMYDVRKRLGLGLPGLTPGLEIEQRYRTLTFYGTTSQAIVVLYNPTGCLRVLDPNLDDSSPSIPVMVKRALHLSQLDLINPHPDDPVLPPAPLRSLEPQLDWCYYFELADLARQQGDWAQVVALGDQAFALNQNPDHAEERIPFIEGYAHLGDWERAIELTQQSWQHNPAVQQTLCHAWDRIQSTVEDTPAGREAITAAQLELRCDT